ncbi:LysR family transcriptional regulator [Shewanella olleyana]|uniref:LysR family transcriptional regulator n=1 Tax=Shewanella olleyana TaxID=135626 RepID=UPI00200D9B9F|nr:LysR family transcriptional regulator [Shewanella olleyana]MCL1065763.1 LysR family transcriptional regulator [Shewanella olleyana]
MNFSLEQLRAFVAVYEQRSFSKAAVKLEKHRTTIGQVITNLEDQVAVELFERVGRAVEPTTDGELLYHYAKQTVQQAMTFDKVALSLSFGGFESITIAYCSFMPPQLLSEIRLNLDVEFPNMKVNFIIRNKSDIKKGIVDGTIHFAFVNIYRSDVINSIDSSYLKNIDFSLCVGKRNPIASMNAGETFNAMKSSRQLILKSLIEDEMSEKVILSAEYEVIDQLALLINFLEKNIGWSVLPSSIMRNQYIDEKLTVFECDQLQEKLQVPISLWSPHSKQTTPIRKNIINTFNQSDL